MKWSHRKLSKNFKKQDAYQVLRFLDSRSVANVAIQKATGIKAAQLTSIRKRIGNPLTPRELRKLRRYATLFHRSWKTAR